MPQVTLFPHLCYPSAFFFYLEYLNFSLTFEGQFCQIQDSWVFLLALWIYWPIHCLLASKVPDEKSASNLLGDTLYVMVYFLMLSRFFVFGSFDIIMCLRVGLWVHLTWSLLSFLVIYVLHQNWEVFSHYFFKYSLCLSLILPGLPWCICWHFWWCSISPYFFPSVFFFSFCLSDLTSSTVVSSNLMILSLACSNLPLNPPSKFFTLVTVLFCIEGFFF